MEIATFILYLTIGFRGYVELTDHPQHKTVYETVEQCEEVGYKLRKNTEANTNVFLNYSCVPTLKSE